MAPVFPTGTAKLVKRVLEDFDASAAEELCRRFEDKSITDLVMDLFSGKLTPAVFNVLADSHDRVRRGREADAKAGIA